jgi:urate oxidase
MKIELIQTNYGKSRVRVVKVKRDGDYHDMKEFLVNVQLEGIFDKVHTEGDNTGLLSTDAMKNTVYALAKNHDINSIEEFGLFLSQHFLDNNENVDHVTIEIHESLWRRIKMSDGTYHNHSFVSAGNEKRICIVERTAEDVYVSSGIQDLLIMKTTGSEFWGFKREQYTTLPDVKDRIFETSVKATWDYLSEENIDYNANYEKVRQSLLEVFANHQSLSVQHTIYEIGKTVLESCEDIDEISFSMPNKHCLLINLGVFNMENNNEIFVPTDEPHGLIEAVIGREILDNDE